MMVDVTLAYLSFWNAYGYDPDSPYPLVCATWAKQLAGDLAELPPSIRVTVSDKPFPDSLSLDLNAPENEYGFHTSINGGRVIDSYSCNLEDALNELGLDPTWVHFRIEASPETKS